ncbi:MAG: hypothetical protein AAF597_19205, partial [Bacteroidota bacterium]
MNWKTLLLCCGIAAFLTGCFATDESLSGPTFDSLDETRKVGELPLDAALESVTFFNAASGQEMTVSLVAPPCSFAKCEGDWCPVADAATGNTYYCPGQVPAEGGESLGLQFKYDDLTDKVQFENFRGSPPYEAWAERGLEFS